MASYKSNGKTFHAHVRRFILSIGRGTDEQEEVYAYALSQRGKGET